MPLSRSPPRWYSQSAAIAEALSPHCQHLSQTHTCILPGMGTRKHRSSDSDRGVLSSKTVELLEEELQLSFRVPEPVRRPDTVQSPTQGHQYLFAEAVPIPRRPTRMVGHAVALHTEQERPRAVRC